MEELDENEKAYLQWRSKFPPVELYGETLYIVGGDIPYSDEELRGWWRQMNGEGKWQNPSGEGEV